MSKTLGGCCPLFPVIIRRDVSKAARRGFEVATPYSLETGKARPEVMIYRFPAGNRKKPDALQDATYAVVKFCPFCGATQERKAKK